MFLSARGLGTSFETAKSPCKRTPPKKNVRKAALQAPFMMLQSFAIWIENTRNRFFLRLVVQTSASGRRHRAAAAEPLRSRRSASQTPRRGPLARCQAARAPTPRRQPAPPVFSPSFFFRAHRMKDSRKSPKEKRLSYHVHDHTMSSREFYVEIGSR